MGYTVDILNSIRLNASAEYQTRIPEATRDNISTVGNALQTYNLLYNEFLPALINKIGKTIIETKLYKNRLAKFKQGMISTQQDVEEIFIGMVQSLDYASVKNPITGTQTGQVNKRYTPAETKVIYHRMNRQSVYPISLGEIDFVRVFRSESSLGEFIRGQINSLYSSANYDEYLAMKNLISTYDGYDVYNVPKITGDTSEESTKTFLKTLRKAVLDCGEASTEHNKAKVLTWTDSPSDLVLFVHNDVLCEVDVEVLSKAFNMGKSDIQVDIVNMGDFGELTDTYGILMEKSAFRVFDTYFGMKSKENELGLFTSYFLHVQQILSLSTFKNTIRFAVPQA